MTYINALQSSHSDALCHAPRRGALLVDTHFSAKRLNTFFDYRLLELACSLLLFRSVPQILVARLPYISPRMKSVMDINATRANTISCIPAFLINEFRQIHSLLSCCRLKSHTTPRDLGVMMHLTIQDW